MSNHPTFAKYFSFLCMAALSTSAAFAGEPDLNEDRHHIIGSRDISETDSKQMREERIAMANSAVDEQDEEAADKEEAVFAQLDEEQEAADKEEAVFAQLDEEQEAADKEEAMFAQLDEEQEAADKEEAVFAQLDEEQEADNYSEQLSICCR